MLSKELRVRYWKDRYYDCNSERLELADKVMDLEDELEKLKLVHNHLLESDFIKTFTTKTNNNQWQRPIYEADIIIGLKNKEK